MQVLILAGGLGTRLQGVLGDQPKPMAAVDGRPFLEYLVLQLRRAGIRRVVLCTGHRADAIERYFGTGSDWDVDIAYSSEPEPRGTGGALRLAASRFPANRSLVMNGDSFFDIPLDTLWQRHAATPAKVTMALTWTPQSSRYGTVEVDSLGTVTSFMEKAEPSAGGPSGPEGDLINAGIYVMERDVLDAIPDSQRAVSLEREVLPTLVGRGLRGAIFSAPFTDIGVPDDLEQLRAAPELLRALRAD